jgi:general secretion pathway protein C
MNGILLKIQKNHYYLLFPATLLLSLALAGAIRALVLLFFIDNSEIVKPNSKANKTNYLGHSFKSLEVYEEVPTGNLIRGVSTSQDLSSLSPNSQEKLDISDDVPGADELFVTGIISGENRFSRVTIKEKDKEEAEEYAIGDKIAGYRVKTIYEHFVVLYKNGQHTKVEVGETLSEAKKRIAETVKEVELSGTMPGDCIVTKKMVSRTSFEKTIRNTADLYKDARFGPNLIDGKIDGYKITQIPSTHPFYLLGARNGDIIKRINGMPLLEPDKMLELWANIKNSNKVTVDIDRKGKCASFDFTISN